MKSSTRTWSVYVHRRQSDGQIFYIGIGKDPKRPYCKNRNSFWKAYVEKYGSPDVQIVMTDLPHEDAKEVEMLLISMVGRRREGGSLVNITAGGGSPSMHDPDVREKVRLAMIGRNFSDETRAKMSLSAKARGQSHGTWRSLCDRISSGWNPMNDPAARRKASEKLTGIKRSDSHRKKNGEVHSKAVAQFTKAGVLVEKFPSARAAALKVGCTPELIGLVCAGKCRTGKGFVWRFASDCQNY